MDHILVGVVPSYKDDDWIDPLTSVRFEKSATGGMAVYRISKKRDLTNIKMAVANGVLVLLEGELPEEHETKAPAEEVVESEAVVEKAPVEEDAEGKDEVRKSKGKKK